jgi:hypothetical protein
LLDNRDAGNGRPRIAHEKFKGRIFLGAKRDFVTATMNSVGKAFELEICDLQNSARRAAAPPQDRANARGELGENEAFRSIIVGACIQPTDTLFHHCGGCYAEQGKVRLFGANPAQDFQAHGAKESKVENDKIVVLIQSQLLRFDAIRDKYAHGVPQTA